MLRLDVTVNSSLFAEIAAESRRAADAAALAAALARLVASHPEFGPRGRDLAADPGGSFPVELMGSEGFWAEQDALLEYLISHLGESVADVLPFLPPVGDDRPVPVTVHPVPGLTACYGPGGGRQIFGLMNGADRREMTLFCSHTYLHEVTGYINTEASTRAEADPAAPGAMVHLMLALIRNEGLANAAVLGKLDPLISEGINLPYFDYAQLLHDEKAVGYAMKACRTLLGQLGTRPPAQLIAKITGAFKNPKLPIINLVGTHLATIIAAQLGRPALVDLADTEPQEFFALYRKCADPLAADLFGPGGEFERVISAAAALHGRVGAVRSGAVRSGGGLIDLSLGVPVYADAIDPRPVLGGARFSDYAPMGGLRELRSAVASRLREERGIDAEAGDVVITAGASGGLFASLLCLAKPGDAIAIPDPGFPLYRLAARSLGLRVLPYRLLASGAKFVPDFDQLADVARQARVLLWNFPSNPLGTLAEPEWASQLLGLLAELPDLHVISDDVYRDLLYEGQPASVAALAPAELAPRLWSLYSFSKSDGLAGWRVGYLHAPGGQAGEVARLGWGMTMSVSTPAQLLALAALETPPTVRRDRIGMLRANRDLAVARLRAAGLPVAVPPAGLFLWPDISGTCLAPDAFVTRAARECGVLLSPGTDFSPGAGDRVRLSLGASPDALSAALDRLTTWVTGL